jgi:two-component system nitrate/nitrite response regulator NarL
MKSMTSPPAERLRVAIVDDHPMFRDGVAMTLGADSGIELVGQGSTAEHAIQIAQDILPDVLLLDISLPGGGIQATKEIGRLFPYIKVIMLTASENEEHVSGALEAGARGYILKGIGAAELLRTVHAVHQGESYVSPQLAARLLTTMRNRPPAPAVEDPLPSLTKREEQILDAVANGRTNKEVAKQLNISEKTVKHYMTNIMHKLQVRNRVEAALLAKRKPMS